MPSLQFFIRNRDVDWTYYVLTGFMEVLEPVGVACEPIEDPHSDVLLRLPNGLLSFLLTVPGIRATFEIFDGPESEAIEMIRSVWRRIDPSMERTWMTQEKYRVYQPLSAEARASLLLTLEDRFVSHMERHTGVTSPGEWAMLQAKLEAAPRKLWALNEMERTGGEPDVVAYDYASAEFTFFDFSPEAPSGRGNVVYDRAAEETLAEKYPQDVCLGNALDMAAAMGVQLLSPAQYETMLQRKGRFDENSSTWLETPAEYRERDQALDGSRYGLNLDISESPAWAHSPRGSFRSWLRV